MAGFADAALQGVTLKIETALPGLDGAVNLGEEGGTPSPVLQLLRPRLTLTRGNVVLAAWAPAGAPEATRPLVWAVIAVAALLAAFWALRRVS